MIYMDVDAALSEVPVNIAALIDDSDFKSREESVAYNQAGMDLLWNFVTSAGVQTQTAVTPTTAGVYDWTNKGNGMYSIEIPASGGGSINNDSEGHGWFSGFATGVLPWVGPVIGFRAAALNDALLDGGDNLNVDVTHIMNTILTEGGGGRLAAAFIKLFDVATPTLVASDIMRGTDSAATATALAVIDAIIDVLRLGIVTGAAEAGTLSTTQMTTDLTEATNDHYVGRIITWTSGVLNRQSTNITAYLGATGMLTYSTVTDIPGAGDTFKIT